MPQATWATSPPRTPPDVLCSCGNVGCLEAVASGPAISKALKEIGILAESNSDIVDLVRGGNIPAALAVRQAGRTIGEVLATCVSLLNPTVIVIGGSLVQAGESLIAGVREVVYGRSLPLATGVLQIVPGDHRRAGRRHRRGHDGHPARPDGRPRRPRHRPVGVRAGGEPPARMGP